MSINEKSKFIIRAIRIVQTSNSPMMMVPFAMSVGVNLPSSFTVTLLSALQHRVFITLVVKDTFSFFSSIPVAKIIKETDD